MSLMYKDIYKNSDGLLCVQIEGQDDPIVYDQATTDAYIAIKDPTENATFIINLINNG